MFRKFILGLLALVTMLFVLDSSAQMVPYGLPIGVDAAKKLAAAAITEARKNNWTMAVAVTDIDRKSTRLNSSHSDRSRMPSSA